MESHACRRANLPKDAVQHIGGGSAVHHRDSVVSVCEMAHCRAMEAMLSELGCSANLPKDAVQRARASQRPIPRRLHGSAAAPMHEDLRGSGAQRHPCPIGLSPQAGTLRGLLRGRFPLTPSAAFTL
jgi:hypothetical protein